MMNKYNTFLTLFIISIVALIVFLVFYIQAIFGLILTFDELAGNKPSPFLVITTLFNPGVIISGIILAITSLAYRIVGIVHVARNKTVSDGEKVLWVIGFFFMGFITAIVFLIMAKGKKLVES